MKAIIYTHYGPPSVLELKEVEQPLPKPNELLVRVHAATVNRTDCANLTGKPFIMRMLLGLNKPRKQIMGTEFAGVVEDVGKNVQTFNIGDKVFGFDDEVLSSYAGFLTIAEQKAIAIMPQDITFQQAAASTEGFHYAFNFLNKVKLKPGDKVMVNGASGGIGSAMVQLLKYYGANITATCATKNIELIKSLGAARVIDYTTTDFTMDDDRYDYVFDSIGKSTFGRCKRLLKQGGTYISSELGPMAENILFSSISFIFTHMPGQNGKKVKFPLPLDKKRSVMLAKKLMEQSQYNPVIDKTYKLEQIADAFEYVLKGQKTGNVVVEIN